MDEVVKKVVEVLKSGGVILYPTDTIWGIGCDATNVEAVNRIYRIKQRDDSKSMIVLVDIPARLNSYLKEVPEIAWDLIDLSEKPLTIIYPGAKNLATNLLTSDGTVGIRVVKHDLCERIIRALKKPIVSTSANISGSNFPKNFEDIDDRIIHSVDFIVPSEHDFSTNTRPSSIIRLGVNGEIAVIRE